MKVIGLTGGIASGKSTVGRILVSLGATVIDADRHARAILEPGGEAYEAVLAHFGRDLVLPDGRIDRRELGRRVFGFPERRKLLESLTHPLVRRRTRAEAEAARGRGEKAVVLDIPLLFEARSAAEFDEIWVVWVDRRTQLQRLMARDPDLTEAEVLARLHSQMDLDEKRRRATVVIDNSGDLAATAAQVRREWQRVLGEREGS